MKRWIFDLLAIAGIFAAYSLTIRLAWHADLFDSLLGGLANTIPVVIFGAIARRVILRRIVGRPAVFQLVAHLLLCAGFAALSYGLLIVLLGLFNGAEATGFLVKPFSMSGTAWQSLENVTTYALIATVSHLQAASTPAVHRPTADAGLAPGRLEEPSRELPVVGQATLPAAGTPAGVPAGDAEAARAEAALSRYFVRIGDEFRPIDIDAVVSIGGADDYAEVCTLTGKHLVRVTLAEFSKSLDPAKYVRVHRSWIVNVHRIARAEPAGGGRLLLHMETGQSISTSRSGAKLLRDRVI
jgi:hypothetical protein